MKIIATPIHLNNEITIEFPAERISLEVKELDRLTMAIKVLEEIKYTHENSLSLTQPLNKNQ